MLSVVPDLKMLANVLGAAANAGLVAGAASWQTNPAAPWQVHAAAAGMGALLYAAGHLRTSPLQKQA
jgi:hypothetical protein